MKKLKFNEAVKEFNNNAGEKIFLVTNKHWKERTFYPVNSKYIMNRLYLKDLLQKVNFGGSVLNPTEHYLLYNELKSRKFLIKRYKPGVNKGNIAYEAFCSNIKRMIEKGDIIIKRGIK